jgi:NTE family protein
MRALVQGRFSGPALQTNHPGSNMVEKAASSGRSPAPGRDGGGATGHPPAGRRRIAIACQGGGSQTAFTAGALRGLFEANVHRDFDIVSLSGTSGGSICATLAWYSLIKGDREPWQRLYAFWRENAARSPNELAFNKYVVDSMRMTSAGRMPSLAFSPSTPMVKMMMAFSTRGLRPLFTDFRGLLEKHVDFAELAGWGPRPQAPVLMMGAVNVLTGRLAKFCSALGPIRVEHLLASSAVPNIFPAVEFDGGAYWDGLFSDNPPISELAQARFVGAANLPNEIWVIKINSTTSDHVPTQPGEISDRRNELVGNMSLFQQIDSLSVLNRLYQQGAFKPGFARQFELDGPIRIPRCYSNDEPCSFHIPFIEMSAQMSATLDYESKIDRSAAHIEALMADGEKQARVFLEQRAALGEPAAG